jgi:hypothetical protein
MCFSLIYTTKVAGNENELTSSPNVAMKAHDEGKTNETSASPTIKILSESDLNVKKQKVRIMINFI